MSVSRLNAYLCNQATATKRMATSLDTASIYLLKEPCDEQLTINLFHLPK